MPAVVTPAKRALGTLLVELRQRAGLFGVDVARTLSYTPTTISRYETGKAVPSDLDLETMLNLFAATAGDRARVLEAAAKARGGTKRIRSAGVVPHMRSFLRAEADADTVRTLSTSAVPGLAQTEAYATLIHSAPHRIGDPTVPASEAVASRMKRQRRLFADSNPLQLHAILDEAVIRRVVALGDVGEGQLAHLVDLAARPNVEIQVMPFRAGIYGTMAGPMTRFGYPGKGDGPAVYLEHPGGGVWVRGEDDVRQYDLLFDEAVRRALSPDDTLALINTARRT
ncbi:helix-turn-helix domain-containing protein [Umezawaea sp. NPDC059074]|uniref:helix-turn-helix domain-containing protein n=1 Tax=Umezawaea sp. NPDC059074 TaxID=3346716 RepID=UPI0036D1BFCB